MADSKTISDSELLKNEADRQKAHDKLAKEAESNMLAVIEKYRTLLVRFADAEDLDKLDRFLRTTTDDYIRQMATPIVKSFSDVEQIDQDFFRSLPGISSAAELISSTEKAAVYKTILDTIETGFTDISYEHRDTLRREIRRQMSEGLDAEQLTRTFDEADGNLKSHAQLIAEASLAGVSQSYNNLGSQNANLDHGWYVGPASGNSRIFCLEHIDKIYTRKQILNMKNNMLEPVIVYCGGWRCRHRWVWVDPAWDESFQAKLAG